MPTRPGQIGSRAEIRFRRYNGVVGRRYVRPALMRHQFNRTYRYVVAIRLDDQPAPLNSVKRIDRGMTCASPATDDGYAVPTSALYPVSRWDCNDLLRHLRPQTLFITASGGVIVC
jgi:hypothetical protein